MLIHGHEVASGHTLEADVAIVGAGPAGLTIARELEAAEYDVIMLEAGGTEPEPIAETGLIKAPTGTYWLGRSHFRGFGGSSQHWLPGGWRARPMDPIDFVERPGVPDGAWPFTFDELVPHFERAQDVCALGPYDYDYDSWIAREARPDLIRLEAPGFRQVVFQLGPPDRFKGMLDEVRRSARIRLCLRSTVARIERTEAGAVASLTVVGKAKNRFSVRARDYVLATGGIDNPKLLLASGGIGNEHDQVGRYFQEHIHVDAGIFRSAKAQDLTDRLFYPPHLSTDGTKVQGAIGLEDDIIRAEGLQNTTVWLYSAYDEARTEGWRSLLELRHSLLDRRFPPPHVLGHLQNVLRDRWVIPSAVRRKLSRSKPPRTHAIVVVESEQRPNPESRVLLTAERDEHGVPVPTLQWRIVDEDLHTIRRTQELINERLQAAGHGSIERLFGDEHPPAHYGGGAHHMGTTRMHTDPRRGVVDPDCRVFGCPNLYVAGSSVFTSSGSANPTLTILALAVRLAEHVKAVGCRPAAEVVAERRTGT
ncbi:MAG: FAD-dependent oxidoreductase [Sandaracinaceae bacterium]